MMWAAGAPALSPVSACASSLMSCSLSRSLWCSGFSLRNESGEQLVARAFLSRITEVAQSDTYKPEPLLWTQVHALSERQSQLYELVTGRRWSKRRKAACQRGELTGLKFQNDGA